MMFLDCSTLKAESHNYLRQRSRGASPGSVEAADAELSLNSQPQLRRTINSVADRIAAITRNFPLSLTNGVSRAEKKHRNDDNSAADLTQCNGKEETQGTKQTDAAAAAEEQQKLELEVNTNGEIEEEFELFDVIDIEEPQPPPIEENTAPEANCITQIIIEKPAEVEDIREREKKLLKRKRFIEKELKRIGQKKPLENNITPKVIKKKKQQLGKAKRCHEVLKKAAQNTPHTNFGILIAPTPPPTVPELEEVYDSELDLSTEHYIWNFSKESASAEEGQEYQVKQANKDNVYHIENLLTPESTTQNKYIYEREPDNQNEELEFIPVQNGVENFQMGIDLFNRFLNFLNLGTNKRKRRNNDTSNSTTATTAEVNPAQHFKYRRVDNTFPEIITQPLDDDLVSTAYPFSRNQQRTFAPRPNYILNGNTQAMSKRSTLANEKVKEHHRKSLFEPPGTTVIKNRSYADVEFSEDEEPESDNDFVFHPSGAAAAYCKPSTSAAAAAALRAVAPPAASKPINIPITLNGPRYASAHAARSAEAVDAMSFAARKQGQDVAFRSGAYSAMGAASSKAAAQSNSWHSRDNTLLSRERHLADHDRYKQLLQQCAPKVYGADTYKAASTSLKKNSSSSKRNQQQVSGSAATALPTWPTEITPRRWRVEQQKARLANVAPVVSVSLLDDEANESSDADVIFAGYDLTPQPSRKQRQSQPNYETVVLGDDSSSSSVELSNKELLATFGRYSKKYIKHNDKDNEKENKEHKRKENIPEVEPVNSLTDKIACVPVCKSVWRDSFTERWLIKKKENLRLRQIFEEKTRQDADETVNGDLHLYQVFRDAHVHQVADTLVFDETESEPEPEFVKLTDEHKERIQRAVYGPQDEVLIDKFNLQITRRDIQTLLGRNWLNDEVINFYMNLLIERGEKKHESHNLPRVYAMNTFFVPRLLQAGHAGVKRWTRRVDLFSMDVIPVPVHMGNVHWCMAIIHLKEKSIKYYDSMGTPNQQVLDALEKYLQDESMDKRKQPFSTADFIIESVEDVPRQMNGSDCGVFSCMFAEYVTRNKKITFSQEHMEYFRTKMILEIVLGELLQ